MKREFIEAVVREVKKLVLDAEVSVQNVVKNNDVTLHGVVIREKDSCVSPTIYLENYFKDGSEPDDLRNVARSIVDTYRSHKHGANQYNQIASKVTNFDSVKSLLRIRLINKELNAKLLETIPHMPFLDMAIIAVIELGDENKGIATIKVTNQLLTSWGKTLTDILPYANENTFNIPYTLKSMAEIMAEMLGIPKELADEISVDSLMYVLSNKTNINGAMVICSYSIMMELANKFKSDLIVLPSSVHEVIIVPMRDGMDIEDMTRMVREVNSAEVKPEEVLSDHAYVFTRKNGWEY